MRTLRLVALSDDGTSLILAAEGPDSADSGERFDLSAALTAAGDLIATATNLSHVSTQDELAAPETMARNRALLRAGRVLTALSYAQRGHFQQDAALDIPPIPEREVAE